MMRKAVYLIAFSALLFAACSVNDKPQAINAGKDACEEWHDHREEAVRLRVHF